MLEEMSEMVGSGMGVLVMLMVESRHSLLRDAMMIEQPFLQHSLGLALAPSTTSLGLIEGMSEKHFSVYPGRTTFSSKTSSIDLHQIGSRKV